MKRKKKLDYLVESAEYQNNLAFESVKLLNEILGVVDTSRTGNEDPPPPPNPPGN